MKKALIEDDGETDNDESDDLLTDTDPLIEFDRRDEPETPRLKEPDRENLGLEDIVLCVENVRSVLCVWNIVIVDIALIVGARLRVDVTHSLADLEIVAVALAVIEFDDELQLDIV